MFRIVRLMALSLLILAVTGCQSRPGPAPAKTSTAQAAPTQTRAAAQTNPTAISAPVATAVVSAAARPETTTVPGMTATSAAAAAPAATSSNLTPQVFIPVAPDQSSNSVATRPATAPTAGTGQPTVQVAQAGPAGAATPGSATPATVGTAAPAQPAQATGTVPGTQLTRTLPYHQDFPQVSDGTQGGPGSGAGQAGTCRAPGATLQLTPSATQVKVGEPLTLTVNLTNQGCPNIETAQYHVAVAGPGWPIGLEPVVPSVVTHAGPLPQKGSDSAVFILRATHAGQPEVSATVNYASSLNARGQPNWAWVSSGPLTIVVTP